MDSVTFRTKKGPEIETVFDDLAALRIAVFRDYPYLYEGSFEYEKAYLKTYAQSERSFLFAVYDGADLVGATTCIPLTDETADIRKPFEEAGFNLDTIFYFGESILRSSFRGQGLGHRFFDEREATPAALAPSKPPASAPSIAGNIIRLNPPTTAPTTFSGSKEDTFHSLL